MELFNPSKLNFKFTSTFKTMFTISTILVILSMVLLVVPGLNYGIDFRGGVEVHASFKNDVNIGDLREILDPKLDNLSIVSFDDAEGNHEFLIKALSDSTEEVSKVLSDTLAATYGPMGVDQSWNIEKMDVVGATVGANLTKEALLSLLYTCILISLYIYWRFDIRFSPGALLGIFHDLFIVVGFLVLLGTEFSTTIVAALLALAGYSINDTVVIYDRIREIEGKYLGKSKEQIVDIAINSTLSRTLMTAVTTLMGCLVLYFVAGPTLQDFAMILFVGILIGTYSSIFVSSPLYLWADKKFGTTSKSATPSRSTT